MRSLSDYNTEKLPPLQTDHGEGRVRMAAAMILSEPAGRLLEIDCGHGSSPARFPRAGFTGPSMELIIKARTPARP